MSFSMVRDVESSYHAIMNREALLVGAPTVAEWAAMKPIHRQTAIVNLSIASLDDCAAQGRELDGWEAHYLLAALGAIYANFFNLAWTEVVKAMAAPNERAPGWQEGLAAEVPSVQQLRAAFDLARYRPVPGA
jgi:hypothetical protein